MLRKRNLNNVLRIRLKEPSAVVIYAGDIGCVISFCYCTTLVFVSEPESFQNWLFENYL